MKPAKLLILSLVLALLMAAVPALAEGSDYRTVEITMDNWQDYLVAENLNPPDAHVYYVLALKEEVANGYRAHWNIDPAEVSDECLEMEITRLLLWTGQLYVDPLPEITASYTITIKDPGGETVEEGEILLDGAQAVYPLIREMLAPERYAYNPLEMNVLLWQFGGGSASVDIEINDISGVIHLWD